MCAICEYLRLLLIGKMDSVDIIIIGAGVIGLGVASEVAHNDRNLYILEKNESFGMEASSRNSEVIHAGIYYPKGTLKAISCREGRDRLYDICLREGIGVQKTGKLIIATSQDEIKDLESVKLTAAQNNVELTFLKKDEVKKIEPNITCVAALLSPETGIVDSHELMKYFLKKAKTKGAELVCEANVVKIEKSHGGYKLNINNQGEDITLKAKIVINCAGNNADQIAALPGIDIDKEGYRQIYLKGNYFRLADKFRGQTKHLVYPVPLKRTLGIHTVLDLQGGIRLGPDEEMIETFDYHVNEERKGDFHESVRKYLPSLSLEDLTPDICGIRPQLKNANAEDFKDFIIAHEDQKDLCGFINLIGMESPGLTASPYLAAYVGEIVKKIN